MLNFQQEQHRITIAQELLNNVNDDTDLLKKIITGSETWVYRYGVETKAQLFQMARKAQLSQIARRAKTEKSTI